MNRECEKTFLLWAELVNNICDMTYVLKVNGNNYSYGRVALFKS